MKKRLAPRGSFSAEASIVLLASMVLAAALSAYLSRLRAEITVQTALDKTACEIASLTYPAARICEAVSAADSGKGGMSDAVAGFAKQVGIGGDLNSFDSMIGEFKGNLWKATSGGEGLLEGAREIYSSLKNVADDPAGALTLVASGIAGDLSLDIAGRMIADPLCRLIMPAYIDSEDADGRLEKLGVKGGMSGIDFSLSDVLFNGKDITLVAVYEISGDALGLRLPSRKVVERAVCAAWVPDSLLGISDNSIWNMTPLERGKEIVRIYKSSNPGQAVKNGYKFSLYSHAFARYTLITSLNPFTAYYSECSESSGGQFDYTIREANLRRELNSRASSLRAGFNKLSEGDAIKLENGGTEIAVKSGAVLFMTVVFPEEAEDYSDTLRKICDAAAKGKGIKIAMAFYDKALGGAGK
ncbi:MAG: hypothetical protein ILO42_07105 [Clostridia bacterium]|nr:hypothetical protein [Clostridia bacterium]MBP5270708.1 hypothetical protein [Clostridia bacterium]